MFKKRILFSEGCLSYADGKRVSNGPLENTNRHIKDYLKMSYSTRDFNRARNRLLHILRNK